MTNYVQQAGLAVSYYLTQQDRPHIVLEQSDKPANAWRNHRWDSFTLNTPNWQSTLPGAKLPGSSPDGFLSRGSSREMAPKHDSEFAGKVALITGGTSGIGAATARRLASLGAKILITGRRLSEGRKLISEIRGPGGCAAFLQTDLREPAQARLVVPYTIETFGRLNFAFNNAATPGESRLLADQTEENFDDVFAVNVKGLFILLKDEIKQMVAQGRGGSIVNSSSISGFVSTPNAGVYGASKSAVLGLTKTAAVEYGSFGIRVNAVSPGAVRTQMLLDVFKSEEALHRMASHHPLGRIGRPEEIADAVVWLFSDRSSYYSGQSLTLDGGLTALRPSIEESPVEFTSDPEGQSLRRISSSPELPVEMAS